jgi:hypothetical protein
MHNGVLCWLSLPIWFDVLESTCTTKLLGFDRTYKMLMTLYMHAVSAFVLWWQRLAKYSQCAPHGLAYMHVH